MRISWRLNLRPSAGLCRSSKPRPLSNSLATRKLRDLGFSPSTQHSIAFSQGANGGGTPGDDCQYCHSDFCCDITLCLAIKMNLHFRSVLNLCEIEPRAQFHGSAYRRILRLRSTFSAYCTSAEFLR